MIDAGVIVGEAKDKKNGIFCNNSIDMNMNVECKEDVMDLVIDGVIGEAKDKE